MVTHGGTARSQGPEGEKKSGHPVRTPEHDGQEMLRSILGCKWTLHVLHQIRAGVVRPGAIQRSAEGLTTKVLNERLAKLVRFGVLHRVRFPEIPPRVEYQFTDRGRKLEPILAELRRLADELANDSQSRP